MAFIVFELFSGAMIPALNSLLHMGFSPAMRAGEKPGKVAQIQQRVNVICFQTESITNSTLKVSVMAQNIQRQLLGIGFDLRFNPAALEFIKYKQSLFFERGGTPIYMSKLSTGGEIVSAVSLKRNNILQKGSGEIISFYFNKKREADHSLAFKNTVAATLDGGMRKDLKDILWGACDEH